VEFDMYNRRMVGRFSSKNQALIGNAFHPSQKVRRPAHRIMIVNSQDKEPTTCVVLDIEPHVRYSAKA
jgi:hypothetical protein